MLSSSLKRRGGGYNFCYICRSSIDLFFAFSARIGRKEDEEDIRREQLELARKRKKAGAGGGGKQKKLKF